MKQKDKELLLKDLTARMLYGVCVHIIYKEGEPCYGKFTPRDIQWFIDSKIENIKPYLRPKSSIAELITAKEFSSLGGIDLIDWYNANHIDYRDLIPLGLALKASEGMYN